MNNPFDTIDENTLRRQGGVKWETVAQAVLPLWVADMDCPIPPVVAQALRGVSEAHLRYPNWRVSPLANPFVERMLRRFDWEPEPSFVRGVTDIIHGLQMILYLNTEPGDSVAVHTPAYPPFLDTLERMGLRLAAIPIEPNGQFDTDVAVDAIRTSRVLLLVNPHNPSGRVFTDSELRLLADTAVESNTIVVSDEVHADLTYPGFRHIPFATLGTAASHQTITLTSATKAFNLAAIRTAVAHIGHEPTRARLDDLPEHLFGVVGVPGVVATSAAWQDGDEWLESVVAHLDANRQTLMRWLASTPGVTARPLEATYLAWLDFRQAGLGSDPAATFEAAAGVKLSPGPSFGPGGEGHARLNLATSTAILTEALGRIGSYLADG